jgi:hypothetical protein
MTRWKRDDAMRRDDAVETRAETVMTRFRAEVHYLADFFKAATNSGGVSTRIP